MTKVAINGFGRIGRAAFKVILGTRELELVGVNDIMPLDNLAYLLKYDTVYGRYDKSVEAGEDALVPAGVLEIVAGGGLSTAELERIGALQVRSAHLASIAETVLDVAPELARADGWVDLVGADLHRTLHSEVMVK